MAQPCGVMSVLLLLWRTPPPPTGWPPLPGMTTWWMVGALGLYADEAHLFLPRFTGNLGCSLVTVALFNLNQLAWSWSVTAEVFGLNNLFVALLMYLMVLFEETDCPNIKMRVSIKQRFPQRTPVPFHFESDWQNWRNLKASTYHSMLFQLAYAGSFVSGLALCNQHTIVIYVAIIAMWVLRALNSTWVSVSLLFPQSQIRICDAARVRAYQICWRGIGAGSLVSSAGDWTRHTTGKKRDPAASLKKVQSNLLSFQVLTLKNLTKIGLYFALGLLPYIYLPLSAHMNAARWTWGDQTSVVGFLTHLLRSE